MRFTQTATYWAPATVNAFNEKTFGLPVQLVVRWEDTTTKKNDNKSEIVMSKATVYLDQDVAIGGYLFLGASVVLDPNDEPEAHLILFFDRVPNLKGIKNVFKAML